MLILNDRIPVHGHQPERIVRQLEAFIGQNPVTSLLLDLERPDNPLTQQIAAAICDALPCPVAVTEVYGKDLSCPVFLKIPPYESVGHFCEKWEGRDLWLDAAMECARVRITEVGAEVLTAEAPADPLPYFHEGLCAHYGMVLSDDHVTFTINRDRQDVVKLLEEAEKFGVTCSVGLWQQLKE